MDCTMCAGAVFSRRAASSNTCAGVGVGAEAVGSFFKALIKGGIHWAGGWVALVHAQCRRLGWRNRHQAAMQDPFPGGVPGGLEKQASSGGTLCREIWPVDGLRRCCLGAIHLECSRSITLDSAAYPVLHFFNGDFDAAVDISGRDAGASQKGYEQVGCVKGVCRAFCPGLCAPASICAGGADLYEVG